MVVNIDHHQDNTRFGDLNLIEPFASSTAEVIVGRPRGRRLAAHPRGRGRRSTSGWSPTPAASATPTRSPRDAPRRRGADRGRRRPGRDVAPPLRGAAARPPAADGARPGAGPPLAGGRMLAAVLTEDDFAAAGGRRHRGHRRGDAGRARACARPPWSARPGPRACYRVSLRTADPASTCRRSPARRAAAATARRPASAPRRPPEDLLAWLEAQMARAPGRATEPMAEAVVAPAPALWLVDKTGRADLPRRRRRRAAAPRPAR